MRLFHSLAIGLAVILLSGCGTIQHHNSLYDKHEVQDTKTYDLPYEKVWQATIRGVGESFFAIDNIAKDSGIITLSFTAQNPNDFIDCGTSHVEGTGTYTSLSSINPVASSGPYFESMAHATLGVLTVSHSGTLTGKVNILVQKLSAKQTKVIIRTRYVFIHIINIPDLGGDTTLTMTFNGNEIGKFTQLQNSLSCVSRGTIDKMILDAIDKELR